MAQDLLLEIGSEELPASFVAPALEEMKAAFERKAREARLSHGAMRAWGTPRRLALYVAAVADRQEDLSEEVLGPPSRIAFDPAGKPTAVAQKWAAAQGVAVEALQQKDTPKGRYVFTVKREEGRPASAVLPEVLLQVVQGIPFRKSMRWGWEDATFARPVQWICALYGTEPISFRFADVESGGHTFGHRFLSQGPIAVGEPARYLEVLERAQVIADPERRRALIREAVSREAASVAGAVREDPELLDTVTFLVEHPTAVLGSFDPEYLDLPVEVLVSEARGHQKYFSVVDAQGRLLPSFVAVSNTPVKDPAVARRGYERVLRARLADARFFFTEDKKVPLASRVAALKRVVFQQKLGTSYEKVKRFEELAVFLASELGLDARPGFAGDLRRAALLCKADLTTGMVGEFPDLQGVMGREYARADEKAEVAQALYEHYLPRFSGDALPSGDLGALVGIADRLDTLVGIIGIGKGPTGAADPYGLRRACLAVIATVLGKGYRFSLGKAVDRALALLGERIADPKKTRAEVLEFFRERLKNQWAEQNRRDVVEAVLSAGYDDMVDAQERLQAMSEIVGRPDFDPLATAFKRAVNIIEKQARDVVVKEVEPSLFAEPAERALFEGYRTARGGVGKAVAARDYPAALREITALKPLVDQFFDTVRVLVDDPALKANRVALLASIGKLFAGIADFSKIQAGEAAR